MLFDGAAVVTVESTASTTGSTTASTPDATTQSTTADNTIVDVSKTTSTDIPLSNAEPIKTTSIGTTSSSVIDAQLVSADNTVAQTDASTTDNSIGTNTVATTGLNTGVTGTVTSTETTKIEVSTENSTNTVDLQSPTVAESIALIDPKVGGYLRELPGATEILFIDSAVQGKDLLALGARTNVEISVLGSGQNVWEQMTEVLSQRQDVQAVHIVSHGDDGDLILGGVHYTAQALRFESAYLESWKSYLTDSADILVYGCDIGADSSGQLLINTLSSITQTDVAASTDTTGSASLGGDWVLETSTGVIESAIFASETALVQYDFVLAAPVNTVPNTSVTPLIIAPNTDLAFTGGNAISIADADNNLTSAQITVLNGTVTATGVATITGSGTASLNIAGSLSDINSALATLVYRSTSTYHGTETLTLVSTDSTSISVTSTVAISVDAVLPTLSIASTKTVLENAVASQLTSIATVTDTDSTHFSGGEVVVSGLDSADVLSIATTGSSSGSIRHDGSNLQLSNGTSWTTIGTVAGGVGATMRITFASTLVDKTVAENVIKAITFYNNSDSPTASRTLSMTFIDGDGGPSTAQNISVTVTPVNDAPVVVLDGAKTVIENAAASLLSPTATITDVDSTNFNGGILQVGGLVLGDVVSIATGTTNTNGAIRLNGTAVELGDGSAWISIGTAAGGSGSSAFTVTFNSSGLVTPTIAENVLRAITF